MQEYLAGKGLKAFCSSNSWKVPKGRDATIEQTGRVLFAALACEP
jgi:hypothetical protein